MCIGDAVWDFAAAGELGLAGIGVRTGGFSAAELLEAGADEVYDSVDDLRRNLAGSVLGGRALGSNR